MDEVPEVDDFGHTNHDLDSPGLANLPEAADFSVGQAADDVHHNHRSVVGLHDGISLAVDPEKLFEMLDALVQL